MALREVSFESRSSLKVMLVFGTVFNVRGPAACAVKHFANSSVCSSTGTHFPLKGPKNTEGN